MELSKHSEMKTELYNYLEEAKQRLYDACINATECRYKYLPNLIKLTIENITDIQLMMNRRWL